jgi:hypothetical protein
MLPASRAIGDSAAGDPGTSDASLDSFGCCRKRSSARLGFFPAAPRGEAVGGAGWGSATGVIKRETHECITLFSPSRALALRSERAANCK